MLLKPRHLVRQRNGVADDFASGFILKQITRGDILDRLQTAFAITHEDIAVDLLAAIGKCCRFKLRHGMSPVWILR